MALRRAEEIGSSPEKGSIHLDSISRYSICPILRSMHTLLTRSNGIDIAYETFGRPHDPPVLLIMGLGTQMIAWPEAMCEELADRGHFVVRFDNRDVGLSTHLHEERAPGLVDVVLRRKAPPYTIDDMARDALGLMDSLGVEQAHVVGASMGGFIAQSVALQRPRSIRSLTLMMTSTGSRRVGNPKAQLFSRLAKGRVVADKQAAQARAIETFRIIGSRGYAFDEEYLADLAGRSYERAHDPGGYMRQLAAITAQPDRTNQLRRLTLPALVMHGFDDPLVSVSGGLALAKALRNSTFVGFSGMGHDLPRELWSEYVQHISSVAARAHS